MGALIKGSDIAAVGIVLDADTSTDDCWQSIADRLKNAGYEEKDIPPEPHGEGTLIMPSDPSLPLVGVWMMPNNQKPDILEDFLLSLIPDGAGKELLKHAQKSIDDIPGKPLFAKHHRPKAEMHIWLAWQKDPGNPFGTAIKAKYLNLKSAEGKIFIDWLKKVFFSPIRLRT
ncbi:MAG: hypothetical protein LBP58_04640 [Azoarcus sp.]|jgi:hypothetical protein|nr:hypothetical protein [Azoarcus sp.]